MKWGSPRDYYEHDEDRSDPNLIDVRNRDNLIAAVRLDDKAWEGIVELVHWDEALKWREHGQPWVSILDLVSERDRDHFKNSARRWLQPGRDDCGGELSEAELFSIASAISALLESQKSPFAAQCHLGDDFEWVRQVVQVSRAFREVLFAIAGDMGLEGPLAELEAARREGGAPKVVALRERGKGVLFAEDWDPARTPLAAALAGWTLEYLTKHLPHLNLAVCPECGRVFERERRDHVYCSKTCQNRVAYKRKRVFDAGVLREVKVDPDAPDLLQPGLWLHHPRLGLGVIEAVDYPDRRLWFHNEKGGFGLRIPPGMSAEEYATQLKDGPLLKGKATKWHEETVDPFSLKARVRFPHVIRMFSSSDLFVQAGENPAIFYSVQDGKKFAELL